MMRLKRLLTFALVLSWVSFAASTPLTLILRATAYTSLPNETSSHPFITATGAHVRLGIVAVSRDLLSVLPYGTTLRLQDLGSALGGGAGQWNYLFDRVTFVVEDTMAPYIHRTIDIWLPSYHEAIDFGVRWVKVTVIHLGPR